MAVITQDQKTRQKYFNNYYHTKGAVEEACVFCGKSVRRAYMYRHLHTRACEIDREGFLKIMTADLDTPALPELGEESPIHVRDASDE
jgi:hypothetical protein